MQFGHSTNAPHTVCVDRTCPGRHFAIRTLFLNIAYTLAVFDITPPVGEQLEAKYQESFIRSVMVSSSRFIGRSRVHFGNWLMYV